MAQSSSSSSSGVGFLGLLALIFIGLKLAEIGVVATWSWWWVLSPLWAPLAVVVAVIGGAFLVSFFAGIVKSIVAWRDARRALKREMNAPIEVTAIERR